jgi:hypothetical protein
MEDLRKLYELWCEGVEDDPDYGNIYEYGLSFDYVAPGTFEDQEHGYFRYQISWGGPSEEFRFYCDMDLKPYKVEFWFLDWFDGAKVNPVGDDLKFLEELFHNLFVECGTAQHLFQEALEDG